MHPGLIDGGALAFRDEFQAEPGQATASPASRQLPLPARASTIGHRTHGENMRRFLLLAALLGGCSEPPADTVPESQRSKLIVAGQLQSDELVEASGLARSARSPDLLWSMNDSGSKARLYAFDGSGFHRGRIRLDGVDNEDWEDLSSFTVDGTPYLLVADTGDNDADRDEVTLHVVLEPDLAEDDKVRLDPAWSIDFRYPDGPRDVEAVAADAANDRVWLLSKIDWPPVLYSVPLHPTSNDTQVAVRHGPVTTLPEPTRQDREHAVFTKEWHWQPTGMDLSPDGRLAVILTYRGVYLYHLDPGRSLYDSLSGRAYGFGLGNFREAESVAFGADGNSIYVTLEGRHPPLLRIDINGGLPE